MTHLDARSAMRYNLKMIKSWKHKGLQRFYESGNKAGIHASHVKRLRLILQLLDRAVAPEDMNLWGMKFHGLKGKLKGCYAVSVSGNWRVTFSFKDSHAILVDYIDYH